MSIDWGSFFFGGVCGILTGFMILFGIAFRALKSQSKGLNNLMKQTKKVK